MTMTTTVINIRLSAHFTLGEFLNLKKYPDNTASNFPS